MLGTRLIASRIARNNKGDTFIESRHFQDQPCGKQDAINAQSSEAEIPNREQWRDLDDDRAIGHAGLVKIVLEGHLASFIGSGGTVALINTKQEIGGYNRFEQPPKCAC